MKIIIIIWLVLGLLTSILVIAALMRSSQISQQEGIEENYDHWEVPEAAPELHPRKAEQ